MVRFVMTALALLSSAMWGSSDFLAGRLAGRHPALAVVAGSQIFGLLLMLVMATATGSWGEPLSYLPWAAVAASSGAVGLVLFYSALATGTMGVVAPIAAAGVLVPFFAGVFAGDSPGAGQLVGVGVAFTGLVLATGPELGVIGRQRAVAKAGLAAVLFGTSMAAIAQGSLTSPVMTMTAMRAFIVPTVLLVAVMVGTVGGLRWRQFPMLALVGTLDVGANLTYGFAAAQGQRAISAVLASLYPVVTMLLAWLVLRERLRPVQYWGVGAVMLGIALIAML